MVPRLYRAFLRLLPASFREDCGTDVGDVFEALWRESRSPWARIGLLGRGVGGLVSTLVAEWWATLGGRERRGRRGWHGGRHDLVDASRRAAGKGGLWGDVIRDIRYTLRQARRSPGFTVTVVLTMALGIGFNTAVFSGVHALLLRPPPGVESPDRLVRVYRTWPGIEFGPSSIPHYLDLRRLGAATFDGVAAWSFVTATLTAGAWSENVQGQLVSANFFEVLGARMTVGRAFLPAEADGIGAHPVVVLSHAYWVRRWGREEDILSRTIRINGVAFRVVGVAAEGFRGPVAVYAPAYWVPLSMQPVLQPDRPARYANRNSNFLGVIARMSPASTVEGTAARAAVLLAGLQDEHPAVYEGSGIRVVPLAEAGIVPESRSTVIELSALLMAVVGLLLLIACVNVANLFLARSEHRRREIRIRFCMGAGRGRIVRQLLTEGLLLVAVAAVAALVLARMALTFLNGIPLPTSRPIQPGFEINVPVLLFTIGTAMASGLLFGLAPALWTFRSESANPPVNDPPARAGNLGIGRGLIVVQTALSMVLLLGAALFLQNLQDAHTVNVGFDADRILNAHLSPDLLGYGREAEGELYRAVAERLAARQDVVRVSWADVVPLGLSGQAGRLAVPGYEPGPGEQMSIDFARVAPAYFETMGIPVRGRGFTVADDSAAPGVVVVNETMADRFWPGRDALGRIVETQGAERTVVGVAKNGKYQRLGEGSKPFLYLPLAQDFRSGATLHVRTRTDPARLTPVLRATIRELDPALPVDVRTMRSHLGISLLPSRIAAGALALFGILGFLLSSLGIYGVVAYTVSRQTRDIGIRVALGADRLRVVVGVVARGMRLTLLGIAIGLLMGIGFAEAVRGLLYTSRALRPASLLGVPTLLAAVALLACWVPARRAARVDPAQALRAD